MIVRYDKEIEAAVHEFWSRDLGRALDWRLWKAQLHAESGLNPNAVSPVGAQGLAQFMPATWREVARELDLPAGASPFDTHSIRAGAHYMAKQWAIWSSPRPLFDRWALSAASYNAGAGNLIKAQRAAGGAKDYASIVWALPGITGDRNAQETSRYVARILATWTKLITRGAGYGD